MICQAGHPSIPSYQSTVSTETDIPDTSLASRPYPLGLTVYDNISVSFSSSDISRIKATLDLFDLHLEIKNDKLKLVVMSRYDSPDPDPHRFTITDYTYHHEDSPTTTPDLSSGGASTNASASIAKPLPAAVSTLSQSQARTRDGSGSSIITSRQSSKSSQVSAGSSSKIRPLPSIPRDPLSLSFSPTSPVAGPSSSSYVTSPVTITSASGSGSGSGSASGHSFITRSPIGESSSSYHPRPPAVRTISDRKVKQPENSLGIQTRPGRNGSGGSSHHQLRLHEVSRVYAWRKSPLRAN